MIGLGCPLCRFDAGRADDAGVVPPEKDSKILPASHLAVLSAIVRRWRAEFRLQLEKH